MKLCAEMIYGNSLYCLLKYSVNSKLFSFSLDQLIGNKVIFMILLNVSFILNTISTNQLFGSITARIFGGRNILF